jgi:hypothetical protein
MATQETVLRGAFEECVKELGRRLADYEDAELLYGMVDGTLGWWKVDAFGGIYFLGTNITEILSYGGKSDGSE